MAPRSTSRSTDPAEEGAPLVVGTVRGPHGVRGEVRIQPQTDAPGRFKVGTVLLCDGVGLVRIASLRGIPGEPIVRFDGYDSRPSVAELANRALRVSRAEARRAAAKGAYLWADLVGLVAQTPEGTVLGTVAQVLRAGAADVLVVRGERERLLPMLDSVVREVDLAGGRIVVTPQEEA